MDIIDLLQWPAMLATMLAAWLIGSLDLRRRTIGFCCFILSNLLWSVWGWHTGAWALIVLQVCLVVLNIRGVKKSDPEQALNFRPHQPATRDSSNCSSTPN